MPRSGRPHLASRPSPFDLNPDLDPSPLLYPSFPSLPSSISENRAALLWQAITQVLLMLEVAPGGTAPTGDEARRVLAFFLSSLKNPTLKRPPTVDVMMSFNTLTPHYEEDVIFALSAADTTSQLGLQGEAAEKVHPQNGKNFKQNSKWDCCIAGKASTHT